MNNTTQSIYLDNSATTPVCAAAVNAAVNAMEAVWGNPSSLHAMGVDADLLIDSARKQLADMLGCHSSRIIFTSGGTESNNLAVIGAAHARQRRGMHIVTSAAEHASVTSACNELERCGFSVTRIKPGVDGVVSAQQIENACRNDTVLVSLMAVNHETGAVTDIEKAIPLIRRKSPLAIIHCDAVQAAGKLPLNIGRMDVDLLSVSAHKLHAPKGCGALYVRKGVNISPRQFGGGQEMQGLRPGTEAVPLIAAFGAAVADHPPQNEQLKIYEEWKKCLVSGLSDIKGAVLNSPEASVPYIVNFSMLGFRSQIILNYLSERGVYVSSGSACSAGKKSTVLQAMGLPESRIDSALRVSFSHINSNEDISTLLRYLREASETLVY